MGVGCVSIVHLLRKINKGRITAVRIRSTFSDSADKQSVFYGHNLAFNIQKGSIAYHI